MTGFLGGTSSLPSCLLMISTRQSGFCSTGCWCSALRFLTETSVSVSAHVKAACVEVELEGG